MEPPQPSQYSRRISASFLGAFVGAELGVLLVALLAAEQAGISMLASAGLLSPVGVLATAVAGMWTLMLHGATRIPPLSEFLQPRHRRWGLILSGPAVVLAWWAVGQLSLRLLVAFHERPLAGGALMATSSLGCFVFTGWLVSLGATALCRMVKAPSMRATLVFSLAGPLFLASTLIFAGSKSGVGAPWALFGVFKRDELQLGPVWQLLEMGVCAYLGALVALKWRSLVGQSILAAGAATLMTISVVSASRIDFRDAVEVERSPGLSAFTLQAFQENERRRW